MNEINNIEIIEAQPKGNKDWRVELKQCLSNPSSKTEYKLKQKALKYILVDDELFKKCQEGLLLKCVNDVEAKRICMKCMRVL